MKSKSILFLVLSLLIFNYTVQAQSILDLQTCVDRAKMASLSIKKMDIREKNIDVASRQLRSSRYPNLNFSVSSGYNFGRTVDPTSNSFLNNTIGFSQFSLSTGVNLYNGGKVKNNIAKSGWDKMSAQEDIKQLENDISLAVANLYLSILFAEENLSIQKNNLAQTDLQKQKLQKLVDFGSRPEGDLINLDYQMAQNYQQIVSIENSIKSLYLDLKQYMDMPVDEDIIIVHPDLNVEMMSVEVLSNEAIYDKAIAFQPGIKSSEYKLKSAEKGIQIAKADLLPSLGFFGSVSTNYSSLGKAIEGVEIVPFPQQVLINGAPSELTVYQAVPNLKDASFIDQVNNNLGQTVGLRLSVPIYNQGMVKASIERSKLNMETLQIEDKEKKDRLRKDVNRVMLDIESAKSEYDAAVLGFNAAKLLLENANKKINLGVISTYDFEDVKTKKETAELTLLIAKYKYLFNTAVLDFYLGRPLSIGQ